MLKLVELTPEQQQRRAIGLIMEMETYHTRRVKDFGLFSLTIQILRSDMNTLNTSEKEKYLNRGVATYNSQAGSSPWIYLILPADMGLWQYSVPGGCQ